MNPPTFSSFKLPPTTPQTEYLPPPNLPSLGTSLKSNSGISSLDQSAPSVPYQPMPLNTSNQNNFKVTKPIQCGSQYLYEQKPMPTMKEIKTLLLTFRLNINDTKLEEQCDFGQQNDQQALIDQQTIQSPMVENSSQQTAQSQPLSSTSVYQPSSSIPDAISQTFTSTYLFSSPSIPSAPSLPPQIPSPQSQPSQQQQQQSQQQQYQQSQNQQLSNTAQLLPSYPQSQPTTTPFQPHSSQTALNPQLSNTAYQLYPAVSFNQPQIKINAQVHQIENAFVNQFNEFATENEKKLFKIKEDLLKQMETINEFQNVAAEYLKRGDKTNARRMLVLKRNAVLFLERLEKEMNKLEGEM
ncbi:Conserved_hypothetical protein [Hexamita inflata]|uniref:Uncharacterized protein n=1 Tax=Hexamita inflata TaxID=28002 RepID=A0AA86RFW5_9EUKA|nr:Conserved hypothetical protein [Hexamita inflata]